MTERVQRVNHLIQQELSQIILREFDFPLDARAPKGAKGKDEEKSSSPVLITLTRVETSSNLIQVNVYISVMPEKKTKEILQILNRQIYQLQQKLNRRLKMRPVPRIKFLEEKKTSEAGRVEEILEEIKVKNLEKGVKNC